MNETALLIGLWGWLYTGPLTEHGKVLGWWKHYLTLLLTWRYKYSLEGWRAWLAQPLLLCATCHAGQVAFWFQVWNWHTGNTFDLATIIVASATAEFLTRKA